MEKKETSTTAAKVFTALKVLFVLTAIALGIFTINNYRAYTKLTESYNRLQSSSVIRETLANKGVLPFDRPEAYPEELADASPAEKLLWEISQLQGLAEGRQILVDAYGYTAEQAANFNTIDDITAAVRQACINAMNAYNAANGAENLQFK